MSSKPGEEMNAIRDRLRDLRASITTVEAQIPKMRTPPLIQYPGILPIETYAPAERQLDAVEEQIKAYLARPITIGKISDRFAALPQVTKDMRPVRYEYPDDMETNKPGITMCKANPVDIAILGRAVLPMMASGFNGRGAAALFTLAYNATTPGGDHSKQLFPDVTELESLYDKAYIEFTEKRLSIGNATDDMDPTFNPVEEAAIYSYIALSCLRLFTKSPSNYVLAWDRIKKGYRRFYGNDIKIQLPNPSEAAMKGLSNWFSIEPRAKQTLYRILYVGNDPPTHLEMKKITYEWHLANTGMHLGNLFVTLGYKLNCNSAVLLQAINVREFGRQIKCLIALLELVQNPSPKFKRQMWRYGRIYDETFMADIQTKSCTKLVYIFAAALKMVSPKTHDKVLNIAQLADVSDVNKRKYEAIAQNLLEAIKSVSEEKKINRN